MPCEEVPMQSLQQIWTLYLFMLPKEDPDALQEQLQKSQSTPTSCRSHVCTGQCQPQLFQGVQLQ